MFIFINNTNKKICLHYAYYIYFSLILESQKVKQQLRHLEKKINDLKVTYHVLNSEKCKKKTLFNLCSACACSVSYTRSYYFRHSGRAIDARIANDRSGYQRKGERRTKLEQPVRWKYRYYHHSLDSAIL